MPLFGSSHKHSNDAHSAGTTGMNQPLGQHDAVPGTHGMNHGVGAGPMGSDPNYVGADSGRVGHGGMNPVADPSMTRSTGAHATDAYPSTAAAGGIYPADAGRGMPMRHDPAGIPPTSHVTHDAHGPHSGGSGSSTSGKMQHAIGSMIGSQSLKQKGAMKEQEAQALKAQSQELQAAEELEREAAMRRERAVAHGAHPDNRHVGGANRPL